MANPGEALAASIDAQWNVGTGGTKPTDIEYIVNTSDFEPNPLAIDAIFVFLPLRGTKERFNSKLRNATYFPRVVCQTKTDTARLEQITNEVDRIVAAGTPITGATYQDVLEVNDISDRMRGGYPFWVSELNCKIFTQFESSATQYGTATTTTLETDEFTVNSFITGLGLTITDFLDEDDMASDSAVALATQQSIKAYIDQANMIGPANAAWVPCSFMAANAIDLTKYGSFALVNTDGTNGQWVYTLLEPFIKNTLKLHITGVRLVISGANATNYVTRVRVDGLVYDNVTNIAQDFADRTTPGLYTSVIAAHDSSGYNEVQIFVEVVVADAAGLDIRGVEVEYYYDT